MKISKTIASVAMLALSANMFNLLVFAEDIPVDESGDDGIHITGLLEPTEEDIQWMEENMTHTGVAQINDLALERINENYEESLTMSTAKFGEEMLAESAELYGIERAQNSLNITSVLDKVDNTTDPRTAKYFPPQASQGYLGSCAAFATTYYQMTYMNALANDYDVKNDPSKILSPKFTYNILNGGRDKGSTSVYMYDVVKKNGCPFNVDFPYIGETSPATNYLEWPTNAEIWESALYNRVKDYGKEYIGSYSATTPVESPDDEDLNLIKTYLANGYVLNISTYYNSWNKIYDANLGNICTAVNGSAGGHSMTVVGYDDTFYYDINGDGEEDPGEFGAFKIINSHGYSNQEWWFMYDALNKVSSVLPLEDNNSNRKTGWWSNEFLWVTMHKAYTPKLTAEFSITTNKRNNISMYLGYGDTDSTSPTKTWCSRILNGGGGAYSIAGTTDEKEATIVLDYTNLIDDNSLDYNDYNQRWFLRSISSAAEVNGFKLKDVPYNLTYESFDMLNSSNPNIWVDAQLPLKVPKKRMWELTFNYPLDAETVNNDTIYVKDLSGNVFKTTAALQDENTVMVTGNKSYTSGKYYSLIINGVKSVAGNGIWNKTAKRFLIE